MPVAHRDGPTSVDRLLRLQRTVGNQAVAQLLGGGESVQRHSLIQRCGSTPCDCAEQ